MDKPKLRCVIQALMFLCLLALAGVGQLMEGEGRNGNRQQIKTSSCA
jgi:hypothetical protein